MYTKPYSESHSRIFLANSLAFFPEVQFPFATIAIGLIPIALGTLKGTL